MTVSTSAPRIALATAREVPDLLDAEGVLLRDELRAQGLRCDAAIWDDPDVPWADVDLVLVRSTWDYPRRHSAFLAWAHGVERVTALHNPASVLAWTTDKHYLLELADAGLPVVPSAVLEPGDDPAGHPFGAVEHVVKPCVSVGSLDTLRLGPDEADRSVDHARTLLDGGRAVVVQPYLSDVDTAGETAVVALDGVVSHAVRKGPLLERGGELVAGLFAEEDITAHELSNPERDLAERVLDDLRARWSAVPLYARIDLLPTEHGPLVLEVELAEPSLFLDRAAGAVERLVSAVVARLPGAR